MLNTNLRLTLLIGVFFSCFTGSALAQAKNHYTMYQLKNVKTAMKIFIRNGKVLCMLTVPHLKTLFMGLFYKAVIGNPEQEGIQKNGKYPVCLQCHAPTAAKDGKTNLAALPIYNEGINCVTCHTISGFKGTKAGSRYFCESLFWASQPKQAAKT